MSMRVGSLFSGIGGMDLGLERAGMRVAWQVEIDQNCQRVLRHHWPEVARYGDVREVRGQDLEPIDLLVGGFPCQDVSAAGRRAGLVGERSGLFYEFVRIAAELAPAWILIENVPGLLSSRRGRDMGAVLGVLADLGYGWAYRVLNAQWFGVPQRRHRVFIVGRAGGLADRAAEVLFEPEGLPWDSVPCREEWQEIAYTLAVRAGSGSRDGEGWNTTYVVAPSLTASPSGCRLEPTSEVLVYQCQGTNVGPMGTLRSGNGHVTGGVPFVTQPVYYSHDYNQDRIYSAEGVAPAVTARDSNQARNICYEVDGEMVVRRLTPTECCRLMALPDTWLDVEPPLSDTAKYRLLGNAVVANVAEWIGRRLLCVHEREMRVAGEE